jgi:hypothetical protein
MRFAHTMQFVAALALVLIPIICVAGLAPHCPTDHRDHDESTHNPSPHSSCLENADWQVKKVVRPELDAVSSPLHPVVDPVLELVPVLRSETERIPVDKLPLRDGSFPLLS